MLLLMLPVDSPAVQYCVAKFLWWAWWQAIVMILQNRRARGGGGWLAEQCKSLAFAAWCVRGCSNWRQNHMK